MRQQQKPLGLVYVTVSNLREAKKLARLCVSKNLAACVNIVPRTVSCYKWEGKIKTELETVMLIKTKASLFRALSILIKKHHSYHCPCIAFVSFSKMEASFCEWYHLQLKSIC